MLLTDLRTIRSIGRGRMSRIAAPSVHEWCPIQNLNTPFDSVSNFEYQKLLMMRTSCLFDVLASSACALDDHIHTDFDHPRTPHTKRHFITAYACVLHDNRSCQWYSRIHYCTDFNKGIVDTCGIMRAHCAMLSRSCTCVSRRQSHSDHRRPPQTCVFVLD